MASLVRGEDSKKVVSSLAQQIGFEAVDAGPLKTARYLEPMAMLWVHLAYNEGFGLDFAFKLIRRKITCEGLR